MIKSLENRGMLLKESTRRTTIQDEEFLNFLKPLMTAGLPLMKNVLTPLAKYFLLLIGFLGAVSAANAATQKALMDRVVLQT